MIKIGLFQKLFSRTSEELNQTAKADDVNRIIRRGVWLLVVGLGGLVFWAAVAPLDEGVPVFGQVTLDTKRKTVQHQSGGIVEKILVHEGQDVKAGQELIVLDDSLARANYEMARQRYMGLRAMESRLLAEQAGMSEIQFHKDILADRDDPVVMQHIATQNQLIKSRRLALQSELSAYAESIRSQEEAIKGYSAQIVSRQSQQHVVQVELKGLRELAEEGYAPRNKQWEQEKANWQLQSGIDDLRANIARANGAIAELHMRKLQRLNEARKEVDSQLAEVQREVAADAEKFHATREELERTHVRAPVEGAVVGLGIQTVGGVIAPGSKLMDVVPKNEALVLEARLPPHMIDHVHPGLPADVRFQGFVNTPELAVEGKLLTVSADLLLDATTNESYYLTRIAVTPKGIKQLDGRVLQPGMPVQIVIKTGERTLLKYLFDPIIKRMSWAMKES